MAKVMIIESEAGWGSKVDEVKEFATREEAAAWAEAYNRKWNPGMFIPGSPTPSWYMIAQVAD